MTLSPGSSLLIDASSLTIETGILSDGNWLARESVPGNALENLFDAIKVLLDTARLQLEEIQSFVYCEGPGSLLGLRLAAMALNTWSQLYQRPIHTYQSLEFSALDLAQKESEATLLAPFRSNSFCALSIQDHQISSSLEIIPLAELNTLKPPFFYLNQRKRQATLPLDHQMMSYSLDSLPSLLDKIHLKKASEMVDVYMPEETEFVTWNAQRHRG